MDLGTGIILAVAALLGANHLATMGQDFHQRRAVFYGIQLANLAAACFLVVYGIPGFAPPLGIVKYLLAGLLIFHIVQNNRKLQRRLVALRKEGSEEEREARRQAVLDKLKD